MITNASVRSDGVPAFAGSEFHRSGGEGVPGTVEARPGLRTRAVPLLVHACGFLLVAWAFAPNATAAQEKETPRVAPSASAPLGQVLEWVSAEGKPYWYRLPRRIDRQRPPNLLLMLHGTGLTWGWAFWNYPIAAGGFRPLDIVVAPEGMTPGQGDTFNFVQGKADAQQIAGLISAFRRAFPIGRVYLYGHSQGAFFCYWFAGEHPELVDGIVAHAGNVLDVKHPKLAKEKVAIGILHGKADAVVSVECAHRTEKIYREQGYAKLKLMVVEGLTAQSGHWPLPKPAAEMLDWIDSVSQETAKGLVATALSELARETPDLAVVVEATARANVLQKSEKGSDKKALAEQVKAIQDFLDRSQAAHAKAVNPASGSTRKEKDYGPWAAHFRIADRAFGRLESWPSSVRSLRNRAQVHGPAIAAILSRLEKGGEKEGAEALKVCEQAFLGNDYEAFVAVLGRLSTGGQGRFDPWVAKKIESLLASRKAADEEGLASANALAREQAAEFRASHAAWFAGKDGK